MCISIYIYIDLSVFVDIYSYIYIYIRVAALRASGRNLRPAAKRGQKGTYIYMFNIYMCIYIYIYTCMYIYTHIHIYVNIRVYIYTSIYLYLSYLSLYIYRERAPGQYLDPAPNGARKVQRCAYIHVNIYMCIYIYTYTCMYTYICTYTCIYIYIYLSLSKLSIYTYIYRERATGQNLRPGAKRG